jgi:hypothetical protein
VLKRASSAALEVLSSVSLGGPSNSTVTPRYSFARKPMSYDERRFISLRTSCTTAGKATVSAI